MKDLVLDKTKFTPEINFNYISRELLIRGECYPENAFEFFNPIMNWITEFLSKENINSATLNVEIGYFNSSTSKMLFDLLDLFEEAKEDDLSKDIVVNWFYDEENETILEYGEEFKEDIEAMTFNLVPKGA